LNEVAAQLFDKYDADKLAIALGVALRRGKPFYRPTFTRATVERAAWRSREHPRTMVDVATWTHLFTRDRMSIASDPIPSGPGGWVGSMFTIGSESRNPCTTISNAALALSILGSDEQQLVRSCESVSRHKGAYQLVISCIPGARS
jgi:hypothetical protein